MYNDYNTDMFVAWLGAWVHKSCIKARDREGERGRGREGGREAAREEGERERTSSTAASRDLYWAKAAPKSETPTNT